MKHKIHFVIALLLTIGLSYFLSNPIYLEESSIPALTEFFSPYRGFWQNVPNTETSTREITVENPLEGEIQIAIDERKVPHIFATNFRDAAFAQGYMHAVHRLWQMDISGRAASGQLSEILGRDLLEYDKMKRRIGMLYGAENALASVKNQPETYAILSAYIKGINSYVENLKPVDYPLEYKLMDFAPRKFEVLDVMIMFKQMAYDLCYKNQDLQATLTKQVLGDRLFYTVFPDYVEEDYPTISSDNATEMPLEVFPPYDSSEVVNLPIKNKKLLRSLQRLKEMMPDKANGSNNWAVAAAKSKTGAALLANDPHLSLTLPSIWYECQLQTPEMNTRGVSIPGIPGVIIGFNEHAAWGSTNVGQDVADWYQIQWQDDSLKTYEFNGEVMKTQWREETISVKGGEEYHLEVPITKAGIVPITDTSDVLYGLAFHWIAHEKTELDEFSTFLLLDQSKNIEDYKKAVRDFRSPAQNLIYAGKSGNIALTVQGEYPLRSVSNARFVTVARDSTDLWQGYFPMENVPQSINPAENFLSSANQKATEQNYFPYFGHYEHFRNSTLHQALDSMDKLGVEEMKNLQVSNFSLKAREFLQLALPHVEDLQNRPKATIWYLNKVKNWDYHFEANDSIAMITDMWMERSMDFLLDEWEADSSGNVLMWPDSKRLFQLMKDRPKFILWDIINTPERESLRDVLALSLQEAINDFLRQSKSKRGKKNYADYKGTRIRHLANIDAFSSEVLQSGGHGSALNAQKPSHGPSWRMVVSLGDSLEAWGVYPGGQSGNPASKNYDEFLDYWTRGEYYPLPLYTHPNEIPNAELIKLNSHE